MTRKKLPTVRTHKPFFPARLDLSRLGLAVSYTHDMEAHEENQPTSTKHRRLSGWTCVGVAALLLLGACFSATLAGAAYWMVHNRRGNGTGPTTKIVVNAPQPIAGPAIDMALPAGCTLTTKQVDDNGGNWWFENADPSPVRVLIATSKLEQHSDVTDSYVQHVIDVVEQAAGDHVISVETPQTKRVGDYSGERTGYDLYSSDGGPKHAEALLLRRESDDLFIVIYGDFSNEKGLKNAAEQIFNSLNVRPTPAAYDLQSA